MEGTKLCTRLVRAGFQSEKVLISAGTGGLLSQLLVGSLLPHAPDLAAPAYPLLLSSVCVPFILVHATAALSALFVTLGSIMQLSRPAQARELLGNGRLTLC